MPKIPAITKTFCIIYNLLGIICFSASFYGFQAIAESHHWLITEKDFFQAICVVSTLLFFCSSFLILKRKRMGYLLPIFLLSFIIAGGFIMLLPLLVAHVYFFTHTRVENLFS